MRKFLPLLLVLLVLVSGVVLANGEDLTDGIQISWDDYGYNDEIGQADMADIWRDIDYTKQQLVLASGGGGTPPTWDSWKQQAEVKIQALAYIPCYLYLHVAGNLGQATVQSFGPGAVGVYDGKPPIPAYQWLLVFDNEIGGFVDGDWALLGQGRNYEVVPSNDAFIQGCDSFLVTIYSNDNYSYEVESDGLEFQDDNAHHILPMDMRTNNEAQLDFTFDGVNKIKNFGAFNHCSTTEFSHKFRVPYDTNIRHGEYSGEVIFRAYTI